MADYTDYSMIEQFAPIMAQAIMRAENDPTGKTPAPWIK